MATLTIKKLPDNIYAQLTRAAKANRRSINSEAIVRLEKTFENEIRDIDEELAEIRKFREEMSRGGIYITEKMLEQAKLERRY